MSIKRLYIPTSRLLDRQSSASAKLVWTALRIETSDPHSYLSPTRLENLTGLSRPTIRKALAQLTCLGWNGPPRQGCDKPTVQPDGTVYIPTSLITNKHLGVQARLLYGTLQAVPQFYYNEGQLKYSAFSAKIHLGVKTVRRAIQQLVDHNWLITTQKGQRSPLCFTLSDPNTVLILQTQKTLDNASFEGEALMRVLVIAHSTSKDYEFNAEPGFLKNRHTGEQLQLDLYFPLHKVALEYNGEQHYRPTQLYNAAIVTKQKRRDRMKAKLCAENGVTLVVINREDLSIEKISQKLGSCLPIRNLKEYGTLVAYLQYRCRSYQQREYTSNYCHKYTEHQAACL
jgi:hypothetical protein